LLNHLRHIRIRLITAFRASEWYHGRREVKPKTEPRRFPQLPIVGRPAHCLRHAGRADARIAVISPSHPEAQRVCISAGAWRARSRDYGYWPNGKGAVKEWFLRALEVSERVACSDHESAALVRAVLADKFRGLWTGAAMYDDLERVCRAIAKKTFWTEGWIATRQTIFHDSKAFSPEVLARVRSHVYEVRRRRNKLGPCESLLRLNASGKPSRAIHAAADKVCSSYDKLVRTARQKFLP
jgi:hypothetical protein